MYPLADWTIPTLEIPDRGLGGERAVPASELEGLAKALGLLNLEQVQTNYRIDRLAGGAYRLHGRIKANGEQACVVSLEPLPAVLDEPFDVEFWPALPVNEGGEDKAILEARDVESLENGSIPVGRIVFETISAALDPYPRKQGAEFNWSDKGQSEPGNVSPFAALAKLKKSP